MTTPIRVLAGLILLAGGLAVAGVVRSDLAAPGQQGGTDGKSTVPSDEARIVEGRNRAKQEIILALIARELGLLEASAWFRELNLSPQYPEKGWQDQDGGCDDEKTCRQVIRWTRSWMQGTMPESQVMARVQELEDELETHIGRRGEVVLPSR
jgi:hypothetical protein